MRTLLNLLGVLGLTTSSSTVVLNLDSNTNAFKQNKSESDYVDYVYFEEYYTISEAFEYDQNQKIVPEKYDITSIFQTFYNDFKEFQIENDMKKFDIIKVYAEINFSETLYLWDLNFYTSLLSAKEVEIKDVWVDITKTEDGFYRMSTRGNFSLDGVEYNNQKITDIDEYQRFDNIRYFDLNFSIRKINENVNKIYNTEIRPLYLLDYNNDLLSIDVNGNMWQINKTTSNKVLIATLPFRNISSAQFITDNELLLVNSDSSIYKFNVITKELTFINKKENVKIELGVTVKNNDIYFIDSGNKTLVNYNLNTNQYRSFYTVAEDPTLITFISMTITSTNKLFVTTGNGILLKFDASTLKLEKKYTEFQHGATASMFENDNKLFIYSINSRLWSLDLNTDQITLISDLSAGISSFVVNEETNEVYGYYAYGYLNIWKIDLKTGDLNLVFEDNATEEYIFQYDLHFKNDKLYITENDPRSTKSKIWEIIL